MNQLSPHSPRALRTLAGLALAAALAATASVGTALPAAAAPATVTVTGTVTDKVTGLPIPDVDVMLYPAFSATDAFVSDPEDYDTTSSNGRYSFAGVEPGRYRIAFDDYFGSGVAAIPQFFGGEPGELSGDVEAIDIAAGSTTFDIALEPGATVSGRIVDANAKPIKNALVNIQSTTPGSSIYSPAAAVYTSTNGRFTARGLDTDDYRVIVSVDASTDSFALGSVNRNDDVSVGDLTVQAASTISGIAREASGSRLKNSTLLAFRVLDDDTIEAYPFSGASTNSRGEYRLNGLPQGDFIIANYDLITLILGGSPEYAGGTHDRFAAVRATVSKPGSKVYRDLRMANTATIQGTVTDAKGVPAAGVPVYAMRNDYSALFNSILGLDSTSAEPNPALPASVRSVLAASAAKQPAAAMTTLEREALPASVPLGGNETTSKGSYSLTGLDPNGSYTVWFGSNYEDEPLPASTATTSVLLTSSKTTLNAKLSPAVLVKGTATSPSGKLLADVTVTATRYVAPSAAGKRAASDNDEATFGAHEATTNSKGVYSLRLPAGTWVLKFSGYGLSSRYLGGGTYPSDPATKKLVTTSTGIPKQDIVLGTSGANVTGVFTDANGSEYFEAESTLERLVDGEVVDSTVVTEAYDDNYILLIEQLPIRRVADGDYRLRIAPKSYSDRYIVPETSVLFTISGAKVTSVNGAASTGTSLGQITLEAPQRVTPLADSEITVVADGPLTTGTTVHADLGDGVDTTTEYLYEWLRDGRPIGSAFGSSYVIQPGDAGARLSVAVARSSEYVIPGIERYFSAPTATVEPGDFTLEPGAPTITGSGAVGAVLTAVPAGDSGESHTFQWRINGVDVIGATKATFTPRIDNLRDTISAAVATDAGEPVVSNRVVVIPSGPVTLASTTASVLVGGKKMNTSRLGAVLTATSTLPASSLVVSYQWEYATKGSNWKPLAGKDRPTLTLSKKTTSTSRTGYSYRVVITAERAGAESGPVVTSKAVKVTKAYKK